MANFSRYTYEQDPVTGRFKLYGWDKYPSYSVLANQARKNFLDSFETEEDLLEQNPDAKPSNKWVEPQVSLNHLPDDGDY